MFSLDNSVEKEAVRKLGDDIGFGNMMNLARDCWHDSLQAKYPGTPDGELAVGPCVATTVPCGCKKAYKCDWCCGSGWLTKRVARAKAEAEEGTDGE